MLVVFAGLVSYSLISPTQAHAYLDPGTGSIIVQAIVAGIVGIATVTRLYWNRIRTFLSGTGDQSD